MLLILTSAINNRLRYTVSLLLQGLLGVKTEITTSVEKYQSYEGPKFNYSREPMTDGLFLEASGLLFENIIFPHEFKAVRLENVPVLFVSANPLSALRFDPLAAVFYMVTRYEEYHQHKKDKYGRFPVRESIAFTGEFLELPVAHIWAEALGKMLNAHYPGVVQPAHRYRFVPTIDIDHAYAILHRPAFRMLGGLSREILHGRFQEVRHRMRVLTGKEIDPYDNYRFIRSVHEPYGIDPLYFYLFADYGGDDNNIPTTHKAVHKLLKELDDKKSVGIHPSLSSNKHLSKLESEYYGLCRVLRREVSISRQHFLKISLPKTYRLLIQLGITHDYSMGYASHPGFRAGIAIPFHFYDLLKNEETALTIHPVSLMDVTLKDYLRLSREKSLETIADMVEKVKGVNGEFVSLWHNESLSDAGRWKGWRSVYEGMLRMAAG